MHEMFRHILEGVVGGKAPDDVEVVGMEVTFGGGRNEFSVQLDATAADSFARLFDDTQARVALKEEIADLKRVLEERAPRAGTITPGSDQLNREAGAAKEAARAASVGAGFPASVMSAITTLKTVAAITKQVPQLKPLYELAQGAVNALIADPETAAMPMRNVAVVAHVAIGQDIERAFERRYAAALKDALACCDRRDKQIAELVETIERLGWTGVVGMQE